MFFGGLIILLCGALAFEAPGVLIVLLILATPADLSTILQEATEKARGGPVLIWSARPVDEAEPNPPDVEETELLELLPWLQAARPRAPATAHTASFIAPCEMVICVPRVHRSARGPGTGVRDWLCAVESSLAAFRRRLLLDGAYLAERHKFWLVTGPNAGTAAG